MGAGRRARDDSGVGTQSVRRVSRRGWLELRQRVESALEVTLPVELFMKDPTPSSLAAELHARSSASK